MKLSSCDCAAAERWTILIVQRCGIWWLDNVYDSLREHLQHFVLSRYATMYCEPLNSWTSFETNLDFWRLISRILATAAQDAKRRNTALGKRGFYLYSFTDCRHGIADCGQILKWQRWSRVGVGLHLHVEVRDDRCIRFTAWRNHLGPGASTWFCEGGACDSPAGGYHGQQQPATQVQGPSGVDRDWAKREASFSLSNVTRDDEAVYGLHIAFEPFRSERDSVQLKVLGKCGGCPRSLSQPFRSSNLGRSSINGAVSDYMKVVRMRFLFRPIEGSLLWLVFDGHLGRALVGKTLSNMDVAVFPRTCLRLL